MITFFFKYNYQKVCICWCPNSFHFQEVEWSPVLVKKKNQKNSNQRFINKPNKKFTLFYLRRICAKNIILIFKNTSKVELFLFTALLDKLFSIQCIENTNGKVTANKSMSIVLNEIICYLTKHPVSLWLK